MLVQIIRTYDTESVLNVQVGISTRITYELNIRTRGKKGKKMETFYTHFPKHYIHKFNSFIENITRAQWGILKSPKSVESM